MAQTGYKQVIKNPMYLSFRHDSDTSPCPILLSVIF